MTDKTELTIFGSIGQGWQLVKGFKGTFWGAFVLYFLFGIGLNIIIGAMLFLIKLVGGSHEVVLVSREVLDFIVFIILLPIMGGVWMLAIKRARHEPAKALSIFSYYDYLGRLFVYQIILLFITLLCLIVGFLVESGLTSLNVNASISMIISYIVAGVPLLYLTVSYTFAIPLIVDKKLGPWAALETSRRTVTPHWFTIFGLMIVMIIIISISFILLLVGLIWTLPLNLATFGVVYHTLFPELASTAK